MNYPVSKVFHAKLTFEINGAMFQCLAVDGDVQMLLGCTASDLIQHRKNFKTFFHPDDQDVADDIFAAKSLTPGKAFTFRLIAMDDDKVHIVKSVVEKLKKDQSAVIQLEISLSFSSTSPADLVNQSLLMNFVSMLDNTDDYIYFKDKYHVFTGASQTLVNITSAHSHWSELIGKTDYEVFSREYADIYFRLEKQVFNGEVPVAQEIQPYLDKSGQSGWVDNRKYPIKNDSGEVIGLFGVARDITKLIETETALKHSELQYRNIYENAPVGFFHSDHQGKLLGCNPAFARMLGYDSTDVAVKSITDIGQQLYIQPEQRISLLKRMTDADGWVVLDVVDWRRKNKQTIHVELFGRYVADSANDSHFFEGAARDITSRVIAERKLQRSKQLYAALSKCNEAIIRCQHEQELFETICKYAVEFGELKMAWIGMLGEDENTIVPLASYGDGREYLEKANISVSGKGPKSQGPTGVAFREDRPVWCQDYQNDPMTAPWLKRGQTFGWQSSAAIPLHRGHHVVGTLNLYSDSIQAFDTPEKTLLLEMASDISYALDRFEEARVIQKYDRELRASQALNRVANKLAKIGAWGIELPSLKLIWSDEVYAIHGVSPKEGISVERALTFYPGKYNKLVRQAVAQCMEDGSSYELDVPMINTAGQQLWTRISGQGDWDKQGNLIAIHGAMQDITRIKENEASLKKLSQAVEQSPSSVLITDIEARIVYVNETFLEQTGFKAEEVLGQNPRFLQADKTLPNDYREMWSALKRGEPWRGEFYNRRKDGSQYIVSLMVSPVRNDDGEIINYLAIEDDITEKKQVEEKINYLAHYDQLTGLPNRVLLHDHFQFAINLASRNHEKLAVMFLDLDNFKNVNDGLGHSVGDKLLIEVSQRLKTALRAEDAVGRLGGDEFIMVLPKTDANGAAVLAQKLIDSISKPFKISPYELSCTPSIGIAIYPEDGTEIEALSRNADAAMYKVKQFSKNGFMFFTPEMQEKSKRNLQLSNALRTAIKNDELYLKYQPQVRLNDMQVIGVEALLRWQHPEYGEVPPAEFIPVAEESGLINEIGRWVLEKAISDIKPLESYVTDEFQMAVNLSVVQFRNRHIVRDVNSLLKKYNVPAEKLTLELTEAVAMSEPEIGIAIMDALHKLGVGIAIDDFGTGYSSLSYIKRFRVHKLKIDKSFIDDIETDADDKAIVGAIISMAKSLDLMTIAEGVETQGQLDLLTQQGCDQMQGYFYSKPKTLAELLSAKWALH